MEHLHGPAGAECVTIALEQIESVRLAARTRRNRRLTGNSAQEETCNRVKITNRHEEMLVYLCTHLVKWKSCRVHTIILYQLYLSIYNSKTGLR